MQVIALLTVNILSFEVHQMLLAVVVNVPDFKSHSAYFYLFFLCLKFNHYFGYGSKYILFANMYIEKQRVSQQCVMEL